MNKEKLLKEWNLNKPKTPIVFISINNQDIIIKDESKNITNTYKARHGWMMGLHYLKNIFPNNFTYYIVSTGNAVMADFAYGDLLNKLINKKKITVVNFYPVHYDLKKLGPDSKGKYVFGKELKKKMQKYNCGKIISVDFNERYWSGKACINKMKELKMNINKNNLLDITEGFKPTYKDIMEELIEQIRVKYPIFPKTLLVLQFGAGILYHDSKEVINQNNFPIDILAVSTGNINSIADKIVDCSETWQENIKTLREKGFTFSRKYKDRIYHVEEQEIVTALNKFRELNIDAEPSGAVGFAILPRLNKITNKKYDLIAFINTGNGINNII
jgi:hypothetical protein